MSNKVRLAQLSILVAIILSSCLPGKKPDLEASFNARTSGDLASEIALLMENPEQCHFQTPDEGSGILVSCAEFLLTPYILENLDHIVILAGSQEQVIQIQDVLKEYGFSYTSTTDPFAVEETHYVEGWRAPQDE